MKVKSAEQLMADNLIVRHLAGSIAYGTSLPTSDIDYRGIFGADPVNIRTPFFTVREATVANEEDTKYLELTHFMKLCLDCNPNIIETLWVDEGDIEFTTPAYEYLRSQRDKLLSSKVAFTFSGYAIAQLKRIKGHNKWINNPHDVAPPKMTDFVKLVQNFTAKKLFDIDINVFHDGYRLIPYGGNIFGLVNAPGYQTFNTKVPHHPLNTVWDGAASEEDDGLARKKPLFVVKFNKEEYVQTKENHSQYWTWRNNRNAKRGELEEQFGYDTKHAMHLVRLLRMGVEILSTGKVLVKRPDAAELLEIRDGSMTYDEIVAYATTIDAQARDVLYKTTQLRKKPDLKQAAQILMDTQDIVWSGNV